MITIDECRRIAQTPLGRRLDQDALDSLEASGLSAIRIADSHGNLSRAILICSRCFGNDDGMPVFGIAVTPKGVTAVEHNNDDIWRYTS